MNLYPVIFGEYPFYKLTIPSPPQLQTAVGMFGARRTIGIWNDNFKTTVSDGYKTFTAANPGWKNYCNHPDIAPYIAQIGGRYDIYGDEYGINRATYGFLVTVKSLYLGDVKNITKLLKKNEDYRPDWIKNVTQAQVSDPLWVSKFAKWTKESAATFPKHNPKCRQAIVEMMKWLEKKDWE